MSPLGIEIVGPSTVLSCLFACPQKPPERVVLLLHGLCSESCEMVNILDRLTEEGLAGLAPDLPGHGKSPGSRGLITFQSQMNTIVSCVQWLREDFPNTDVVLAGHSFGAYGILASVPLLTPPPVLAAIIGAPKHSGENLKPLKRILMLTAGFIAHFFGPLTPGVKFRCSSSFDFRRRHIDFRTLGYAIGMNNLTAAGTVPPSVDGLVVRGKNDPDTTTASAQTLFNALGSRRKRLLEIPDAGHSPFQGQPARILARALTGEWD